MRRPALLFFFLLAALPATAQFHIPPPQITGWYVAPGAAVSWVSGKTVLLAHAGGGVMFNNALSLGLAGNALLSEVTPHGNAYPLRLYYGGLDLEWLPGSNRLLHVVLGLTVGPGVAWYEGADTFENAELADKNLLLILEGRGGIELNLTRRFRAGLNYNVRLVDDLVLPSLTPEELAQQGLLLVLKIGSF